MSLIPFILDLADELHELSRCLVNGVDINDFGFGLYSGTDQQPQQQPQTSPRRSRNSSFSSFWMPSKRHHPYNRIKTACCAKSGEEGAANPEKSDTSSSVSGTAGKSASYSVVNKNGFQVSMNVKQFAPNELSVKTIDNCIVVEGRHDDKEDGHGVISRHFVRKYMLPKGYDPNDVLSTLSSDGILTVKAPPPPPPVAKNDESNERVIEIQPTPGPTPVLVVSAKDTPSKETVKKLVATPPARLEFQLPEKRQKLDLPPEPEESTKASIPPTAVTENECYLTSAPAAETETELEPNDVEMEKSDEPIADIVVKQLQQQTSDVAEIKNNAEKKAEIIEQAELLQKKWNETILNEAEKKLLDEYMSESNGDSKKCEKVEEFCNADAAKAAEKIKETTTETKIEESIENVTKMDVDYKDEGKNDDEEKIDSSEIIVAKTKTADNETKASIIAAATDVTAKNTGTDPEETNNTDTLSNNAATTTTISTSNNNSRINCSSTANNNSLKVVREDSAKDVKDGNGVSTGKIPVDIPNSVGSDAATNTTTKNTIKCLGSEMAESVVGGAEIKTAVLSTNTTTNNNVALLKATTADTTTITDNTDGNVVLTESIDGITTTADINTNANTTITTVDDVECSLFAKKAHLGIGNKPTATPLVGTEEMAN